MQVYNMAMGPLKMRKRKYVALEGENDDGIGNLLQRGSDNTMANGCPIPQCHNIVSTSQISTSQPGINLQRIADLYPFTTYGRKRFAAITIRLSDPHCTCLLFGSGKLVITGSTSFRYASPTASASPTAAPTAAPLQLLQPGHAVG